MGEKENEEVVRKEMKNGMNFEEEKICENMEIVERSNKEEEKKREKR